MKATLKTALVLSLSALLALSMFSCNKENNKKDESSTTTTPKLTTLGDNKDNPDKDKPGTEDPDKDKPGKDDPDKDNESKIKFISGDEKAAQTTEMGNMVYWYDQDWNGANVNVTTSKLTDGVYEFAFTHTGANWFGAQLFYNPVDAVNGNEYEVSFKIKSTVDTKITVCGTVYTLKANEEQTVSYDVTLDMNPASTDYQYGQSAFDVQFGVEEGNVDIVDGTYYISELVLTKK